MNCLECNSFIEIIRPQHKKSKKYCCSRCQSKAKAKRHYRKHGTTVSIKKFQNQICLFCKNEYKPKKYFQKFCSLKCSSDSRRKYLDIPDCLENSHRKLDKNIGYVRVYAPMHNEANTRGYVYEHRLLVEQSLGRKLEKNEIVHHKNGKRWDNRIENLQVMDRIEHSKLNKVKTEIMPI